MDDDLPVPVQQAAWRVRGRRVGLPEWRAMAKKERARPTPLAALGAVVGLYLLGYGWARTATLHTVEHYTGLDGKGGARRDSIAKRDQPPGAGWDYQLFLPAIMVEEALLHSIQNP